MSKLYTQRPQCCKRASKERSAETDGGSPPGGFNVAPFPVDGLPEPLRRFVQEAAKSLNCPLDFVGVPPLSLAGMAVGTIRSIEVKPGWEEYPLPWTAIVAPAGSTKTPALNLAMEPLRQAQREWFERYDQGKRDKRSSDSGRLRGQSVRQRTADVRLVQGIVTDATIEPLATVLAENPRGVMFCRDELTAWARSMNEYKSRGRGADRPHWLSMWSLSTVVINRKNLVEPIVLDRPFVAVAGCLQPEMLGDLEDERGREDGFIHRILFSYPECPSPAWTEAVVSDGVREEYRKMFDALRRLPISLNPNLDHIVIRLAPEAKKRFVEWVHQHNQEIAVGPPALRGIWTKMVAHCARLALVIYLVRFVSEVDIGRDVDEKSVASAISLAEYFKSHARKVHVELRVSAAEARILTAVEWIRRQSQCEASLRDIITAGVAGCRTNYDAHELFDSLERAGWGGVQERKPTKGGRTKHVFVLRK